MTRTRSTVLAALATTTLFGSCAMAQDFYDTSVLRTLNFQFHDANWLALLRSNYAAQTNILADLTVDGVTYPNVGVRIRGNTSYTALPAGSEKFSLNVEIDAVDLNQEVMGYSSLNLNNGFHDPTFCREVLYNNYVAQFIPNPRANHVLVTLNGQNWGVYNNIQQFNRTMLSTHFADTNGLRIKCANNPNGPGLRYNGAAPSGYTGYEIKADGGLADPWGALISVCNTVTNAPTATWMTSIDPNFAVDPSIWSVVFENILTDDDSYVHKGADFVTYRNPTDGRTFLLQTDANETFTMTSWAPTLNFTQTTKPVLSRVLAVPELRQRFFAHYRTAMQDLNWTYFGPLATALRDQIDAAVQADPKKLYTYALFQSNFANTVTMPYSGPAGGSVPGLQQFCTQRTTFLNTQAELVAQGPAIQSVSASDDTPNPTDVVTISAAVTASASGAVARVDLYYRPIPTAPYQRVQMTSGGSGTWSVALPIIASPGQRVDYYVSATTSNSFSSLSFYPSHTEWAPLNLEYTFASSGGMRITEYAYSGASGEFVEFTNFSTSPIDLTGWSFDDDHAIAGAFSLTALGTVQPNESVVITEVDAAAFRTSWGLPSSVKVLGGLGSVTGGGNNLARNDQIHLYNEAGTLVDRLRFGDQTFPGTVRAQNASAQTCEEWVGTDTISEWALSVVGDVYGSFASSAGDRGTPGSYNFHSCETVVCIADVDDGSGTGVPDGGVTIDDLLYYLGLFEAGVVAADVDDGSGSGTPDGGVTIDDLLYYLSRFEAGC